jgi:hypothetical protein
MKKNLYNEKRGISVMIGYVLLVGFIIIMSIMVYSWMKTYVPTEDMKCPQSVSLFITEKKCTATVDGYKLNITLRNIGKFSIAGFFIKASNSTEERIATIDLANNLTAEGAGVTLNNQTVLHNIAGSGNSMIPGAESTFIFDLGSKICLIEIIPARYQEVNEITRFLSCGDSRIKEEIECV